MDAKFWMDVADRYGVPLVLLLLVCLALWRGGWQLARWFKPWVEKFFETHFTFIQRVDLSLEKSNETNEKIEATQARVSATLAKQGELLETCVGSIDGFKSDNVRKFAEFGAVRQTLAEIQQRLDNLAALLDPKSARELHQKLDELMRRIDALTNQQRSTT